MRKSITTLHEPYTVSGIIQRLEARIGAQVVEFSEWDESPIVRRHGVAPGQIAREAQHVVDEGMHRWQ